MTVKAIIHPAEEGCFCAEVPSIQECATQGDTIEELLSNLYEAVKACLSVDLAHIEIAENDRVLGNCSVKSVSGKHFARILENRGWSLIRVNGSHHVYMQPGSAVRISLPTGLCRDGGLFDYNRHRYCLFKS